MSSGGLISFHYSDVMMRAKAFQVNRLTIVYSTGLFRRRSKKTSKLRVTGLCEGNRPVSSTHKGPITRKIFPFDNVIKSTVNSLMLGVFHFFQTRRGHLCYMILDMFDLSGCMSWNTCLIGSLMTLAFWQTDLNCFRFLIKSQHMHSLLINNYWAFENFDYNTFFSTFSVIGITLSR